MAARITNAIDDSDTEEELPCVIERKERNTHIPQANAISRDIADEKNITAKMAARITNAIDDSDTEEELPCVVDREERSTPIRGENILSRENARITYIPRVPQREESNTPSEEQIFLSRDFPDELPPSIRFALPLSVAGIPEPDIPIEDLSMIKTDQLGGESQLYVRYMELLESQDATHSELVKLEMIHGHLRTEFESWVHRIPGLLKFSLPFREREQYKCVTFRPHASEDERRCHCYGCFFALKSPFAKVVQVMNIMRKEISLVKKEHLALLEEFETFQKHSRPLLARLPIERLEWDVNMVFGSS